MSNDHPNEEEIFYAAREICDDAERSAYLDEACAGDSALRSRVEALIEASEAQDTFLRTPVLDPGATILDTSPVSEGPGDVIGRYKLLQQIGEGGFGVVYMADQLEPVRRRVALKVIKLGMDTNSVVARFEAERQALALMEHPNIARALDAGATETGRPYFVMELVRGIPITDYCDQNKLSTEERLELFVQVCSAVQHAHQKGVIHRDLKPSNVLVTLHDGKPVPKVIDFGIARAMDRPLTERTLFTSFGQFVGTPQYMSPEQAEMSGLDIDTRADIYTLGVLLYELLTGTAPFEEETFRLAGYDEMCRIIREVEPPRPSTRISTMGDQLTEVAKHRQAEPAALSKLIRGDLDWIVMKAMEKDRTRRYGTASELAQDVERHLSHEPVVASPPGTVYRLHKFVRRNRLAVTAGLLVAASLVLGLSLATVGFVQASRQRDRAVAAYEARLQAEQDRRSAELETEAERRAKDAETAAKREEQRWNLLGEMRSLMGAGNYGEALTRLKEAAAIRHDRATRLPFWVLADVYSDRSLATLQGHAWTVTGVAFGPEGKLLVSAGHDSTVRLWDVAKGEQLRTLSGHQGTVYSVAFSADGRTVASGGGPGENVVRLWDVATGEELRTLNGHDNAVSSIAFSPDGKTVVSGSYDQTVRVWNVATGEELLVLPDQVYGVTSVTVSPDGKSFASAAYDNTIRLWDIETGAKLWEIDVMRTGKAAVSLAFSPDGKTLASGDWDNRIRLRDAATGELLQTLAGHTAIVHSVAFSPDGRSLVSGSADATVKVWRLGPSATAYTFGGHTDEVLSVAFSPDGRTVASAAGPNDKSIRLWDATPAQGTRLLAGHTDLVNQVAVSADGRTVATAGEDATVRLWNAETGELRRALAGHTGTVLSVAFSPDGKTVASGGRDNTVKLWEKTSGKEIRALVGHGEAVTSVAFSPGGRTFASGSADKTVKLWAAADGKELHTLAGHHGNVLCVTFSPDGGTVASGSYDKTVKLWDVATGQELRILETGHTAGVCSVAFAPDGRTLATGSRDCTIGLFDVATGEKLSALYGHSHVVESVAFSPDGKLLASASTDETLRLWDIATGREAAVIGPLGSGVRSVAFTPDGNALAYSVGKDVVVRGFRTHDENIMRWLQETGVKTGGSASIQEGAPQKKETAVKKVAVPVIPESPAQGSGSTTASAKSTAAEPERFVLEGVPKVAYHTDRWRFTPFCNALDACLQYLGEPEQTTQEGKEVVPGEDQ